MRASTPHDERSPTSELAMTSKLGTETFVILGACLQRQKADHASRGSLSLRSDFRADPAGRRGSGTMLVIESPILQ